MSTYPTEAEWAVARIAEARIRALVGSIVAAIGPEEAAMMIRSLADEVEDEVR